MNWFSIKQTLLFTFSIYGYSNIVYNLIYIRIYIFITILQFPYFRYLELIGVILIVIYIKFPEEVLKTYQPIKLLLRYICYWNNDIYPYTFTDSFYPYQNICQIYKGLIVKSISAAKNWVISFFFSFA